MTEPPATPAEPIVGYLVSEYPAPSHTFIRREIDALRSVGVVIRTYSVRIPKHVFGDDHGQRAVKETFYILATSPLRTAQTALAAMMRRPRRFFSTLGVAVRHRVPGLRALVWSLFHFAEAIALAERMRADGVKRLHNHFGNAGATVGLLAAHFNGIPWSLTLHGISEFDYPAGNLLPDKLERAEFAACVSYFGMAQAMRLIEPRLWSKLHIVRCAIDPREMPQNRVQPQDSTTRIICVGRLAPEKGQIGLFKAARGLVERGVAVHLTLVGDGPQRCVLEAEVQRLGLSERVDFLGALDERATLHAISGADILALPSFMEGLPTVLMEGMALRVPVVASRVAGIPELIADEESGLLFAPANWDGLEEALHRLANDRALRRRLTDAGYAKVSESFFQPEAALPLKELLCATRYHEPAVHKH